jgi:peptide/nickel transport system substrate-binding protein
MSRHHRRIGTLALSAALAAGVLACGTDAPSAAGRALVVGVRSDFSGFNSITNSSQYTDELIKYALFTPLVQYDEGLDVRPWLAESWRLEGDTAVVFTLRSDVAWHDGEPVDAGDVVFTFERAKDPEAASLLAEAYLSRVARAEAVDARTVRFVFDRPHAQALEDFWWAPMPEHLLADVPVAELRNAQFNRSPVGSGPFRFAEWRAAERLVLETNDAFPEALGGPPAAARVVIRVIPEAATRLTELVTGGIHADIDLAPDQADDVANSDGLRLLSFPGRTVYFVAWNNRREPFTDPRVRRALTHAIDRDEIIAALLGGFGAPATSPIPPWSPLSPGVEPLAYDTEAADRLLAEAGWEDRDGDGVRENGAGEPLRFTLLSSDRALNRAVVEVVQAHLRQVGVDVRLQVTEFQTMLAQFRGRDYDAAFANWVLDNFQVGAAPFALFHSEQAGIPGSANRTSFANATADSLLDAGRAPSDPDLARSTWGDFVRLLRREQPATFMFWLDELAGVGSAVAGVDMDPRGEFRGLAGWAPR